MSKLSSLLISSLWWLRFSTASNFSESSLSPSCDNFLQYSRDYPSIISHLSEEKEKCFEFIVTFLEAVFESFEINKGTEGAFFKEMYLIKLAESEENWLELLPESFEETRNLSMEELEKIFGQISSNTGSACHLYWETTESEIERLHHYIFIFLLNGLLNRWQQQQFDNSQSFECMMNCFVSSCKFWNIGKFDVGKVAIHWILNKFIGLNGNTNSFEQIDGTVAKFEERLQNIGISNVDLRKLCHLTEMKKELALNLYNGLQLNDKWFVPFPDLENIAETIYSLRFIQHFERRMNKFEIIGNFIGYLESCTSSGLFGVEEFEKMPVEEIYCKSTKIFEFSSINFNIVALVEKFVGEIEVSNESNRKHLSTLLKNLWKSMDAKTQKFTDIIYAAISWNQKTVGDNDNSETADNVGLLSFFADIFFESWFDDKFLMFQSLHFPENIAATRTEFLRTYFSTLRIEIVVHIYVWQLRSCIFYLGHLNRLNDLYFVENGNVIRLKSGLMKQIISSIKKLINAAKSYQKSIEKRRKIWESFDIDWLLH